MRYFTLVLAIALGLTGAGCASKSSSNSDQSNAEASAGASSAPEASGMSEASSAPAGAASVAPAAGDIPAYPGATTAYSATAQGSSGTVMTTDDSFDKVYAWYQQHMPAGAEKAHMTAPVQSAVFSVGPPNDVTSVSISAANGKTTITIGHQKT
jgi:hypothetical protein